MIELFDHQKKAIDKLESGSILNGGVGSGKSLTSIHYYFVNECGGSIKVNGRGKFALMTKPKDLYIITTAQKRDKFEWVGELNHYLLGRDPELNPHGVKVVIDSWNNIKKYADVKNAFFIFDEQRLVSYGAWSKTFLNISKYNNWLLLTATPGEVWKDYMPVFIANGFYKNKTDFYKKHVVFKNYMKYPVIDHYVETGILMKYRKMITVNMPHVKNTISHKSDLNAVYDYEAYKRIQQDRWNIKTERPIKDAAEMCRLLRHTVNNDASRLVHIKRLLMRHNRLIVFYNFDYELEALRSIEGIPLAEWNGHKHEAIPDTDRWIYLVQYTAGAEGWNCISTNAIAFYSLNYSWKMMHQAAGRIDRMNTKYKDLYYYYIKSDSSIDKAIGKVLVRKKKFQEKEFESETGLRARNIGYNRRNK